MNPDLIAAALGCLGLAICAAIPAIIARADRPTPTAVEAEAGATEDYAAELHEWNTQDTALPAEMLATSEMPAVTEDEWWDYQPKHLRVPPYITAEEVPA